MIHAPWWHPAYPPYPYYRAGAVVPAGGPGFDAGVTVGAAWNHGWGYWDWGHHDVNVNVNRNVNINRNINVSNIQTATWQHDAAQRGGVPYRDQATRQQYGQQGMGAADSRRDYRGYSQDAGDRGGWDSARQGAAGAKQRSLQKRFRSPEEAAQALAAAAKANDMKELAAVLGPEGQRLISSGDEVSDRAGRERFVRMYEEKNQVVKENDQKAVLEVGSQAWPLPIPIIKVAGKWRFDTKAGKQEILKRRIGKNELSVIQVCRAYVDAQREYAGKDRDGDGLLEYAQKFVSDPGRKDGLYWEVKPGEEPSPLGPFAANAREEGYQRKKSGKQPSPYHGYYYKVLKAQGKNAPGGAFSYVVNGSMLGGFALVAYPAAYGSSGIMSFLVRYDGVVYEKDLGKNTQSIARALKNFDPDKTWRKVEPKYLNPSDKDSGASRTFQNDSTVVDRHSGESPFATETQEDFNVFQSLTNAARAAHRHPRAGGGPGSPRKTWIPAFAHSDASSVL